MTKYFSVSYILSANPEPAKNILVAYIIVFTLIIILGIIISTIFSKKAKKTKPYKLIQEKIIYHTVSVGIIGLLLVFFLWQEIPYLSSPIVVYILIAILIYLLVIDSIYYKNEVKSEIKKYKQELKYQKYLPKKNKK